MPNTSFFIPRDQISFVASTINHMYGDKLFEKAQYLVKEEDGKKRYLLIENLNNGVDLSYEVRD